MAHQPRKSIFDSLSGFGQSIKNTVTGFFSSNADDDEDAVIVDDHLEEETTEVNTIRGTGYELSWRMHKDPAANTRPWFFTSQLGAPFPSYHANPTPDFPARWTLIDGVKPPCESLTAPRIRLGPRELQFVHDRIDRVGEAAAKQTEVPKPKALNLTHQSLGDPYQFSSLVAFLDLNREVEVLNLNDNELEGITALNLSKVKKLYLSNNSFASFLALPSLPNCEELYLSNNFITSTAGLSEDKFPKLRKITVGGNPIESQQNFRKNLRKSLPKLQVIDKKEVTEKDM